MYLFFFFLAKCIKVLTIKDLTQKYIQADHTRSHSFFFSFFDNRNGGGGGTRATICGLPSGRNLIGAPPA